MNTTPPDDQWYIYHMYILHCYVVEKELFHFLLVEKVMALLLELCELYLCKTKHTICAHPVRKVRNGFFSSTWNICARRVDEDLFVVSIDNVVVYSYGAYDVSSVASLTFSLLGL